MIEKFFDSKKGTIYHSIPSACSNSDKSEGELLFREVEPVATDSEGKTVYALEVGYQVGETIGKEIHTFTLNNQGKQGGHLGGFDRPISQNEFLLDRWGVGRTSSIPQLNCQQSEVISDLKN